MKPLTPQRKKELLILAGAGAAAIALLYLRAKNGAASTSGTTGAVGPLFDPSSLLGGSGAGFDTSSSDPFGTDTSGGTDLTTAADTIGNDVASAIATWLAGQPVAAPLGAGAADAVVTPTNNPPFQYDTGPVTIKVTPVSSAPPAPAGGNDTPPRTSGVGGGGQAPRAVVPSAAKVDKAPSFAAEAPKTQQLAATAAKNNQVLTKGRQLQ